MAAEHRPLVPDHVGSSVGRSLVAAFAVAEPADKPPEVAAGSYRPPVDVPVVAIHVGIPLVVAALVVFADKLPVVVQHPLL